jgi:hypothetical protein
MSEGHLLKTKQAAVILGVAEQTMNKWRCLKQGPPYIKYARAVLYRPEDLMEWRARFTITPTNNK